MSAPLYSRFFDFAEKCKNFYVVYLLIVGLMCKLVDDKRQIDLVYFILGAPIIAIII